MYKLLDKWRKFHKEKYLDEATTIMLEVMIEDLENLKRGK